MSFSTKVAGKWILAGEHAVLRGSPALVFPLYSRALQLDFVPARSGGDLQLQLQGEHGEELQLLFWGVVERATELRKIRRADIAGSVLLRSSIPVGAGLGASAALSVAVTKWFCHLKLVLEGEAQEFARNLENLFHGESSGVDVAVALSGQALHYVRGQAIQFFQPKWQPRWYVSYSGKRGVTMECVKRVKDLLSQDPALGQQLDRRMQESVAQAERALQMTADSGFDLLVQAIDQAGSCFQEWGLTEGQPSQHMEWLRQGGARAVKPTGSGNGGYVLSLWDREPSAEYLKKLIPCFMNPARPE